MARDPIVPVRADAATKTRWQEAAKTAGVSLSEFVRRAVDQEVRKQTAPKAPPAKRGGHQPVAAGPRPTKPPPKREDARVAAVPAKQGKARTAPCVHRVAPGSFCSRGCDS